MLWVAIHLPHIVPPLIAFFFLARLAVWAAAQPPSHYTDDQVDEWNAARREKQLLLNQPVRRRTARFGITALMPLLVSFVTGLWIYTLSLRGQASDPWLIWLHVGTGSVGLLLVTIKAGELGRSRIAARLQLKRPQDAIASLVMLGLGVPIAVTGVLMLFSPSGGAFTIVDYLHVITGIWWTLIVQWHLFRYLTRALRALSGGSIDDVSPDPSA